MYAAAVQDLIDELGRLPGIGPKSAQRIAFYLSEAVLRRRPAPGPGHQRRQGAGVLVPALLQHRRGPARRRHPAVRNATSAGTRRRDASVLCVVEEPRDVVAVEKTREYRGRYHVLQGAISPIDGIGPDKLRIRELLARLATEEVKEVILCTNPNIEGEATAAVPGIAAQGHCRSR